MSKNPPDSGIDLHITQLFSEEMVETTWPRIHPLGHPSLTEWLNPAAEKGAQEIHTHQPSSQELLNDLTQGL
jgi:hypothetical protein